MLDDGVDVLEGGILTTPTYVGIFLMLLYCSAFSK